MLTGVQTLKCGKVPVVIETRAGAARHEFNYVPSECGIVNVTASPALYDAVPACTSPVPPREYRLRHSGHYEP